jgi:formamidopyrimidine-DNA glycosylase
MTGHLLIGKWEINGKKLTPLEPETLKEKVNDYIHFILTLDDKRMIGFSDLRKFGKVVFGEVEEVENLIELKKLGPGALDSNLKFEVFQKQISKKTKTIYQVLMDQEVISGIYIADARNKRLIHENLFNFTLWPLH